MLSRREQDTYDFICNYINEHQQGPLLEEIAAGLGIKSKGVVHRYVQTLAKAERSHANRFKKALDALGE